MAEVPVKFRAFFVWNDLKKGIEDANKGLEKLGDGIKDYGREQKIQARNTRLFSDELRAILPASDAATKAITGLAAGLLGGIGIGTGFEIAKVAIEYFSTEAEKAKKEAEQLTANIEKLGTAIRDAGDTAAMARLTAAMSPARAALEKELAAAEKRRGEAEKLRAQEKARGEKTIQTLNAVGQAEIQIADIQARIVEQDAKDKEKFLAGIDEMEAKAAKRAEERAAAEQKVTDELAKQAAIAAFDAAVVPPVAGPTAEPVGLNPIKPPNPTGEALGGATGLEWSPEDFRKKWIAEQAAAAAAAEQVMANIQALGIETAGSLGEAFGSALAGTESLAQSLEKTLIKLAIQWASLAALGNPLAGGAVALVGGLFSAGLSGKREFGGPVYAGQPYLVGERGPEVVVPGASGTVIPNSALGSGGVTMNFYGGVNDGASTLRTFKANERAIARAMRESSRRMGA
mgnify:FL=1